MADLSHRALPARGLQGLLLLTLICAVGCFDGLIEDPGLHEAPGPAAPPNLPTPPQNPGAVTPTPTSPPTPTEAPGGPVVATDTPVSPNPGNAPSIGSDDDSADLAVDAGVSVDAGDAGTGAESYGTSLFADAGSADSNVSK